MNDNPPIPAIKPVLGHPEVIRVLEETLAMAVAGKVAGVAIIMSHGGDGVSTKVAGAGAAGLIAGCQQMTQQLLGMMFKKPSHILMPRRN